MQLPKKTHLSAPPAAIAVRRASLADVPALSNLYVDFLASYGHPADSQAVIAFLQTLIAEPWVTFFVAVDNPHKVVGFCGCTLSYSAVLQATAITLEDMFVQPSARRQGVATALCNAVEAYARDKRFATLFLQTAPDAEAAVALYKKAGFETRPYLAMSKVLSK